VSAFETRETADGAMHLRARGATLGSALAATADGVAAVRWPSLSAPDRARRDAAATADDPTGLLFDYLDELSYQRDVRGVVPVDNDATVAERGGRLRLSGTFRGVEPAGEGRGRRVAAATDPPVTRTDGGWTVELRLE
jgi:SHS2 domain-containing protein